MGCWICSKDDHTWLLSNTWTRVRTVVETWMLQLHGAAAKVITVIAALWGLSSAGQAAATGSWDRTPWPGVALCKCRLPQGSIAS